MSDIDSSAKNDFGKLLDNLAKRAERVIELINKENPYNAFVSTIPDLEERMEIIRNSFNSGNRGLLFEKLIAVKDNICIKGSPTTCGSNILRSFIPPYNATVIEKIISQNGLIVGKTNMDEFAMGSSSEYSCFGPVRNPNDETRVPGGSSGGSAAAVAGGLVDMALGSDTGGSVRQPAAFCGVVGLKPTYGRVSRYGLVAFSSSLDQIGTFSKNVEDSATLLNVVAGADVNDSTSVDLPVPDYKSLLGMDVKGIKIGIPDEYYQEGLDKEIEGRIYECIDFLERSGAIIERISLKYTPYSVPVYYIIATAEASSNLARYDGIRYGLSKRGGDIESVYRTTRNIGFGDEVIRRIMLGTYALSAGYYEAYYDKAQRVRRLIKEDFVNAFQKVDIIFTPTTPTKAFEIGKKVEDPLEMYLSDVYTTPASLAGLPAISIPLGLGGALGGSSESLPIGGQLIGNYFCEGKILQVAHFIEGNFSPDS